MTNLLKFASLLILPFLAIYIILGFVFWNWDMQNWSEFARASYVCLSFMFSILVTTAVIVTV